MTGDSVASNAASTNPSTSTPTPPPWQTIAQEQRSRVYNSIPKSHILPKEYVSGAQQQHVDLPGTCGILSPRELEITGVESAGVLLERIRGGVYSSVEVAEAFCKRASVAHQVTNCLTEILYPSALARAKELDEYLLTTGKTVGPLHGLPISIKEHVHLAGTRSTSGFIAWADNAESEDALIVEVFRKAGAVFHVKTTDPQSLLCLETNSNLYGRTLNPYNTNLTPGGSSGGEGALIAMRGSLLGVGTDIGGSIRCPAAFCGLYGFKPSVARIPHGGLAGAHGGMDNIVGVVGPLGVNVEDMELFCKVAIDYQPWRHEPSLVNIPWDSEAVKSWTLKESLTIGLMLTDDFVDPHPHITRCLQETAAALEKAGHRVVKWTPPVPHKVLNELIMNLYFLDGGNEYREIMAEGGEPPVEIIEWILESFEWKNLGASDTWKLNKLREQYRTIYAKHWTSTQVDAILCPAFPTAASIHDTSKYWGYTSAWNLLDYSSIVFPAGQVLESDGDISPAEGAGLEKVGRKEYTPETVGEYVSQLWWERDGEGRVVGTERYRDAPVALQLVGRRYEEEKVLGMLKRVLEARRGVGLDGNGVVL